jgi:hypothetical protein
MMMMYLLEKRVYMAVRTNSHLSLSNTSHSMRSQILVAVLGLAVLQAGRATAQGLPQSEAVVVERLMARVGAPPQLAIDEFKKAGMQAVTAHTLTDEERVKVEAALALLPALNKNVLEKKLHFIAFVDGIPGEGTGLTSPDAKTGLYDITLRASILDEPLSTFLTTKEQRVYTQDGSEMTVTVIGTGANALTYVLLHESSHVVDNSCGITGGPHSRFTAGIWMNAKEMVPSLREVMPITFFRGGIPLPIGEAATVYNALARTPFVTLYATASEHEDFAELVTWHEILKQHGGNLVIQVKNAQGETLQHWEPISFPGVQRRFADVDELLASHELCRRVS